MDCMELTACMSRDTQNNPERALSGNLQFMQDIHGYFQDVPRAFRLFVPITATN